MPSERSRQDAPVELYSGPLETFISRRDELARRLRSEGDAQGAAAVAKLRRPPLSVWAVNQLAQRQPDDVAALLAAGGDLRALQGQVLEGRRLPAEAFRGAAEAQQRSLDALVRQANGLLRMTGHAANEATLAKIRQTLHAASVGEPDEQERLRGGTLTADLAPPGFEGLGPVPDARGAAPSADQAEVAVAERAAEAARREAAAARRQAERAVATAEREERSARALAEEAERAQERALAARAEADAAQADARDAETAAAEAERRLDQLGGQPAG